MTVRTLLGALAGAVCVGAGIYLLSWQSASSEANWFETIGHGIGIYFIGKGVFVALNVLTQDEQLSALRMQLSLMERAAGNAEDPRDALPPSPPA